MRGLIEGFNKSRRKISIGVKEMAGGSMREMRFWTTPKGDLPHYSFIFRKPDPLEIQLKKLVCSRLGVMLYLEIQKG